jgi:hypothetical protein
MSEDVQALIGRLRIHGEGACERFTTPDPGRRWVGVPCSACLCHMDAHDALSAADALATLMATVARLTAEGAYAQEIINAEIGAKNRAEQRAFDVAAERDAQVREAFMAGRALPRCAAPSLQPSADEAFRDFMATRKGGAA